MLEDFNLLATTSRGNEQAACSELRYLLQEIGDPTPAVDKTKVSGLVTARTSIDPFEAIKKFRNVLLERPYEFRYTLRIIPIEKVFQTDLGELQKTARELSAKIGEDETFRVTIEKRFTTISTQDLIEAIATKIERKVDLEKPSKILLVEVVGRLTGVSLIQPNDVLSIMKEKML